LTTGQKLFGCNTLEIVGLSAGSTAKPVGAIPGRAEDVFQLRFVEGTDWQNRAANLRAHLNAAGFADVEVRYESGYTATCPWHKPGHGRVGRLSIRRANWHFPSFPPLSNRTAMRYDLTSLDIFIAVAEERNLTRVARIKHLALSAISKRIAELEAIAGSPLLVRNARGVDLTPAGQSMLFYARQLKQTLTALDDELGDYASGVKGHVRIHAITSALSQFLPDDIARFVRLYPQIKFDIEERVGSAVVRAVSDGRADLGIIADQTAAQGLEIVPYRRDELTLVVPQGHPLSAAKAVRFHEVLEHEFIGPHLESSVHSLLTSEADKLGKSLKLRIRISSFDCMCRMVSTGLGLAVLPRTVVQPYLRSHRLKALTLQESWAQRQLLLAFRKYELASPTLKTLIDNLQEKA
jgi:DNA-binding transcriptional LysR family regulator